MINPLCEGFLYSGVEERYLERLITSRHTFDSCPRNNHKEKPLLSGFSLWCNGVLAKKQAKHNIKVGP